MRPRQKDTKRILALLWAFALLTMGAVGRSEASQGGAQAPAAGVYRTVSAFRLETPARPVPPGGIRAASRELPALRPVDLDAYFKRHADLTLRSA